MDPKKLTAARRIYEWLTSKGSYQDGLGLLYAYHSDANLKRYWGAREGQEGPEHYQRLSQALRDLLNSPTYWRAKLQVQKEALPVPKTVKAPPKKRSRTKTPAQPASVPADAKEALMQVPTKSHSGAFADQIRRLANSRAKLSNQLVDPGDDEAARQANCLILDQIGAITDSIEQMSQAARMDPAEVQQAQEDPVILSTVRGMNYRLSSLQGMTEPELREIRERITEAIKKAHNRSKNMKSSEATRQRNAEKVQMLKQEVKALDVVISQKKWE